MSEVVAEVGLEQEDVGQGVADNATHGKEKNQTIPKRKKTQI